MNIPTKLNVNRAQMILIWSNMIFWGIAGVFLFYEGDKADIDTSPNKETHAVIAITCPYQPFYDWGDAEGTEWKLIADAFA